MFTWLIWFIWLVSFNQTNPKTVFLPWQTFQQPGSVQFFYRKASPIMSIQWFPGHMNAACKEAAKTMEVIDVIVEVLDARIPNASSNPLIKELRLPASVLA